LRGKDFLYVDKYPQTLISPDLSTQDVAQFRAARKYTRASLELDTHGEK
jgi:hypothetical protein